MLQTTISKNVLLGIVFIAILGVAAFILVPSIVGAMQGPTAVTVDLQADGVDDELIVEEGLTFTLTWVTTGGPKKCTASGGWNGRKDVIGGSEVLGPITERTQYNIECRKGSNTHTDSVWVDLMPVDPPPPSDEVTLLYSEPCTAGEGDCTQHRLSVVCQDLPAREADVWEFDPATTTPLGGILLTIGGQGRGQYGGSGGYTLETRNALVDGGYQVFAVDWAPEPTGWFYNGAGYADSVCGYAPIAQWVHDNVADNPATMCAAGNSGGAFQIMYGLELYGTGDVLDMVVPSSGPPIPQVDDFCFNPDYPLRSGGGAAPTNDIMGWTGNGDYCKSDDAPQAIIDEADRTSIVSHLEPRSYNYPNTKVNYIHSEQDNSGLRGAEYVNMLTSEKVFYPIPGSVHNLQNTAEGSALIQQLLLTECVDGS